jgi:hypothetical protein
MHSGIQRTVGIYLYGNLPFTTTSSFFTSPDVPQQAYPEGFQGNAIPIDGKAVAKLCEHRLALSEEADD